MARFDVYANPVAGERKTTPYLVDVQNDYINGLQSRIVIPLRKEAAFGKPARDLNPVFSVDEVAVVLDTAALGAIPTSELKRPLVSLRSQQALIQEALDALFGAY